MNITARILNRQGMPVMWGVVIALGMNATTPAPGQVEDCNGNGIKDAVELLEQPAYSWSAFSTIHEPSSCTARATTADGRDVPFDADGDGHADILVGFNEPGGVSVHFNDGSGAFPGNWIGRMGGMYTSTSIAGDLDGDGDHDLVIINHADRQLTMMANNGSGVFGKLDTYKSDGVHVLSVKLDDLDGDGDLDLSLVSIDANYEGTLFVLMNNGSGRFKKQRAWLKDDTLFEHATADLDGDGDIDIATGDWQELNIMLNNGRGDFSNMATWPSGAPSLLTGLITGDIDSDGDIDVIGQHTLGGAQLVILRNQGNGNFGSSERVDMDRHMKEKDLVDLNGDGSLELVGRADHESPNQHAIIALVNPGNGQYSYDNMIVLGVLPNSQLHGPSITSADFDGDGDMDCAAYDSYDRTINLYSNDSLPPLGTDSNGNGMLDDCECRCDIHVNGRVGVDDLLVVLSEWGSIGRERPDVDNDGMVNTGDLLKVMGSWGDCEPRPGRITATRSRPRKRN